MRSNYLSTILNAFYESWDELEKILLLPAELPSFIKFLSHYRGQAVGMPPVSQQRNKLREQIKTRILQIFLDIFKNANVSMCAGSELESILAEAEKCINLAFYSWFGLNDQNYQLRTVVHFFEIEGVCAHFSNQEGVEFTIALTENGMCFGVLNDEREPCCLAISKMCGYFSQQPKLDFENTSALLSQARIIQREICFMTNEWEYLNSILAVEFGELSQVMLKNKTPENQEKFASLLKKMDRRRMALASWCLESLCDFQEELLCFHSADVSSDVKAENEAIAALILASLQKIFLPASVSRLRYNFHIVSLFQRFAQLRARFCPDDMAAQFLLQVTQSAQGEPFSSTLLNVLRLKSFEWKLCFDPAAALKSFTWSYSRNYHLLLCSIFAICYFKKLTPALASELHLSEIAACLQAQDFASEESQVAPQPALLPSSEVQEVISELMLCLNHRVKKNKATDELVAYIKQHISYLSQDAIHA